jgi:uncharacterized membrane protein YgdD (TMEM256/DUF423 family)
MDRTYLRIAFILGAITVALGAFGAHGLKGKVSNDAVEVFKTGVLYQFIHVFALAIAGILCKEFTNKWIRTSGIFFLLGILMFSGSLYVLTYATATVSPNFKWVGPITPIGGLMFIVGWICLALGVRSNNIK